MGNRSASVVQNLHSQLPAVLSLSCCCSPRTPSLPLSLSLSLFLFPSPPSPFSFSPSIRDSSPTAAPLLLLSPSPRFRSASFPSPLSLTAPSAPDQDQSCISIAALSRRETIPPTKNTQASLSFFSSCSLSFRNEDSPGLICPSGRWRPSNSSCSPTHPFFPATPGSLSLCLPSWLLIFGSKASSHTCCAPFFLARPRCVSECIAWLPTPSVTMSPAPP